MSFCFGNAIKLILINLINANATQNAHITTNQSTVSRWSLTNERAGLCWCQGVLADVQRVRNSQPKLDENLERFLAEYEEYKGRRQLIRWTPVSFPRVLGPTKAPKNVLKRISLQALTRNTLLSMTRRIK